MSKIRGFEKVSKYTDIEIEKPIRKTDWSAGYDMVAAHDAVLEPIGTLTSALIAKTQEKLPQEIMLRVAKLQTEGNFDAAGSLYKEAITMNLDQIKTAMKEEGIKPTLVSTGYKIYMQPNERVTLILRSSTPLNSFIIMPNSLGLIDSDYYDNPDNEGEVFFQLLNLSPVPIQIRKGDVLGQAVFSSYLITDDDGDQPKQARTGGFGSTSS